MAEELRTTEGSKSEQYALLYEQLRALLSSETDSIARMATAAAAIHHTFRFWWTGFYRVAGEELVLGPFQGPVACTRIRYGRGVCGSAWQQQQTILVPDVDKFPGHIACSSASQSEIVVPMVRNGAVVAVLDIDSEHLATFDEVDQLWLEKIINLL